MGTCTGASRRKRRQRPHSAVQARSTREGLGSGERASWALRSRSPSTHLVWGKRRGPHLCSADGMRRRPLLRLVWPCAAPWPSRQDAGGECGRFLQVWPCSCGRGKGGEMDGSCPDPSQSRVVLTHRLPGPSIRALGARLAFIIGHNVLRRRRPRLNTQPRGAQGKLSALILPRLRILQKTTPAPQREGRGPR